MQNLDYGELAKLVGGNYENGPGQGWFGESSILLVHILFNFCEDFTFLRSTLLET